MSGTLNKVMLIGHTGDDVKMHHFEGGGCVGRFPLATNENYTNKTTGEKVSSTEWHNVVVGNKTAEICEKYLKKGDKVYVEGKIKTRKWQDQEGNDRYSTEIQGLQITFLTPKQDSGSNDSESAVDKHFAAKREQHAGDEFLNSKATGRKNQAPMNDEDEDDLPF